MAVTLSTTYVDIDSPHMRRKVCRGLAVFVGLMAIAVEVSAESKDAMPEMLCDLGLFFFGSEDVHILLMAPTNIGRAVSLWCHVTLSPWSPPMESTTSLISSHGIVTRSNPPAANSRS